MPLESVLAAVLAAAQPAGEGLLNGVVQLDVTLKVAVVLERAAAQPARVHSLATDVHDRVEGLPEGHRLHLEHPHILTALSDKAFHPVILRGK